MVLMYTLDYTEVKLVENDSLPHPFYVRRKYGSQYLSLLPLYYLHYSIDIYSCCHWTDVKHRAGSNAAPRAIYLCSYSAGNCTIRGISRSGMGNCRRIGWTALLADSSRYPARYCGR